MHLVLNQNSLKVAVVLVELKIEAVVSLLEFGALFFCTGS